jgi:uncharacterized tellurite resistance protein B-like protein
MLTFSTDPRVAEDQMHAVIFYLTAFGYIDGDFDSREKGFIQDKIRSIVSERAAASRASFADLSSAAATELVDKWTQHFHEVLDNVQASIEANFEEAVADGENAQQFVLQKLKLRCYELFKKFDEDNRSVLLDAVDELMRADGVIHPSEARFRAELSSLLNAPLELDEEEVDILEQGSVVVDAAKKLAPSEENHPFFSAFEFDYAKDPETFRKQSEADMALIAKVRETLAAQRAKGNGTLGGKMDVRDLATADPFLDGHIYGLFPKPNKAYELLVLGDLHGCYTCLKGALLQADFFRKVEAFRADPVKNPDIKLVLLGDYIDRGRYSYNGVLRTVMQLFVTVPEHVYMLRGNHEYYVEYNGRIYGGVKPAEAINSLADIAPKEVFEGYMNLFEDLPNMLIFDRTLFVHAGIPRDETMARKWGGLESLNDAEIRFQMLWSDPSEADFIPPELQKANARFPFGKKQFKSFLARTGLNTMVRGHERIVEGFKVVYDEPEGKLLNLFSAGGKTNNDLPETSNYRDVAPMALTIRSKDGVSQVTPFLIDYEKYNDPKYNAFFKAP